MSKPRYSIIRVDNKCIRDYKNINCPYNYTCSKCKSKKIKRNIYGDTKEQLIKKVAQAIRQIADIEGDDKEYKYWGTAKLVSIKE